MSRRSFFIDENLSPDLSAPLLKIHHQHKFASAQQVGLRGVDDVQLFEDLASRGFGCIITIDREQLSVPDERTSLRRAGLHWVGLPTITASGTSLLSRQLSIVAPAIQDLVDGWERLPTAYYLVDPRGSQVRAVERI